MQSLLPVQLPRGLRRWSGPIRFQGPISFAPRPKLVIVKAGGPGSGRHPGYGIANKLEQLAPTHPTWQQHYNYKQQAYGGVIVNNAGKFLLRSPTNYYDGYVYTFPKGKMDSPLEHPSETAVREVKEESGYKTKIEGALPGTYRSASGSNTSFYVMSPVGKHDPAAMDDETHHVRWVGYDKAKELIGRTFNKEGRKRDLDVLQHAYVYLKTRGRDVAAGGPGSGCHGDNCGRPAGPPKQTSATVMKKLGWSHSGNETLGGKPAKIFTHYKYGKVLVSPSHFIHYHPSGETAKYHKGTLGSPLSSQLKNYLQTKVLGQTPPTTTTTVPAVPYKPASNLNPMQEIAKTINDNKPVPLGMHQQYVDKDAPAATYTWNPTSGEYDFKPEGTAITHSYPKEGVLGIKKYLQPVGVKPEVEDKKVPPNGMPASVKGPKGGIYTWDADKQAYAHPAGYTISQTKVQQGINEGTHKPVGALDVPPPGMHTKTASVTAPVPKAEFTYIGSATSLGGAHDKYTFEDKNGGKWLFKPAETLGGEKSPIMAHADEAAAKMQKAIRPDASVEVKTAALPIPGKGNVFGSIQQMVPSVKSTSLGNVTSLNQDQIKALQQEHVVDWLISNHDSHGNQFLTTGDGKTIGIDKSQAFKYFPNDKLSMNYHPNAVYGEKPPIYNQMMQAVKEGKLSLDPKNTLDAIKKAEAISDTDYKKMLSPYAAQRFSSSADANKFLDQAVDRKNNLRSDFEKLYSQALGKPFSFKEVYPDKPDKISSEMHQKLTDLGYSFSKYGAKTGFPLYTDKEGKAVYISDPVKNTFEYYPMGTHGTNPYGSTKAEGTQKLEDTLKQPFEKPQQTTTAYKPTSSSGLTPELQAKFDALPTKPMNSESSGSPGSNVTQLGTYSPSEKSTVGSYKGSGYHSINGFLWQGNDAELNHNVKNMDSAVAKGAIKSDTVLWRGIKGDYANDIKKYALENADKPGTTIIPVCFQSTATNQSFSHGWASSGGVVFKLNVPAGTPAVAITHVTGKNDGEHEIVLSRHVTYEVKELYKSDGKLYIEANVVHSKTLKASGTLKALRRRMMAAATKPKQLSVAEFAAKIKESPNPDAVDSHMTEVYDPKTDSYVSLESYVKTMNDAERT